MKYYLMMMACVASLLLASCKANMPVAQQSGKEDVAFLLFVSESGKLHGKDVQVNVDGNRYDARVVKEKKSNRRGTQYSCPTGNHQLTVTADGAVVYNKKVFLSTQQVKNIMLP